MQFKQTQGAKTVVGPTGVLAFDGPDASTVKEGFVVSKSEFVVDGGKVDLNSCCPLTLSGTADLPAILSVTNGGYFAWRSKANGYGRFALPKNTKVRVHDGAFCFSQARNQYWSSVCDISGGELEFSGTGVLSNGFKRADGKTSSTPFVMRSGKMTFRDTSRFWSNSSGSDLVITPSKAGEQSEVSFSDSSRIAASPYSLTVGDSVPGGRSVLTYSSSATSGLGASYTYVGFMAGQGELNISSGYLSTQQSGLYIGTVDANFRNNGIGFKRTDLTLAQYAPTGIVRVTGGALHNSAVFEGDPKPGRYSFYRLGGLMVGDASVKPSLEGRPVYGRLEVSGGCVTNEAHFVVGAGPAVGRVVQTGGEIWQGHVGTDYGPSWGSNYPGAIGLAGGDGEFVLSNGVTKLYTRMFVGGATTNDLLRSYLAYKTFGYPFDAHNAVGKLTVACHDKSQPCSFSIEYVDVGGLSGFQGLWVGRDGNGTLEMIGSGGTIKGHDIVLTNGYATAEGEILTHGQATVRCVLDEDGIGLISATRNLKIAPNAKLEVDVRNYKGKAKKLKLLGCKTRYGAFAPENITVRGSAVVLQNEKTAQGADDPAVYVRLQPGLMLILR